MLNTILAGFYERDLHKLIEEINSFKNEENLWRTGRSLKNSCGNLVLHIIGGLNHFIGATLAQTGYLRNRDQEFARKDVTKDELISQLRGLIILVGKTLNGLEEEQMKSGFPIFFDQPNTSTSYVLIQLLTHLNYHLGQINYLRRILEPQLSRNL